jgi:hypothetical protein
MGMGVKRSQTTKGPANKAALEVVSMSESEQAARRAAEVYEAFYVPALPQDWARRVTKAAIPPIFYQNEFGE